jgi:hypothetical protein
MVYSETTPAKRIPISRFRTVQDSLSPGEPDRPATPDEAMIKEQEREREVSCMGVFNFFGGRPDVAVASWPHNALCISLGIVNEFACSSHDALPCLTRLFARASDAGSTDAGTRHMRPHVHERQFNDLSACSSTSHPVSEPPAPSGPCIYTCITRPLLYCG